MYDDISHELEYCKTPTLDLERHNKEQFTSFMNLEYHEVLLESKRIAFKQLYRLRERKLGSTHEGYKHIILSLKRLLEYDIGLYFGLSQDKEDYQNPVNQIHYFIESRHKLLNRIFKFLEGIYCTEHRTSRLTHRDKRNLVRPLFIHLDDIERLYLNETLYESITQLIEFETAQRAQEAVA